MFKSKKDSPQRLWALKGINLTIRKGEVIGIVGENGSGKTTLLRLIAGILRPDEGSIKVQGRVSALLELGAAFHPELTGRENIYLNGVVLGLSRKQIESKFEDIVRYSELKNFIDFPLKTYSAGMCVRLGFATAISIDPEILLVDEVLAVGDEAFQRKCLQRIGELKKQGKTIIFVSHNMGLVSNLCERTILLRDGKIVKDGPTDKVISFYLQTVGDKKSIGILRKGRLDLIFSNGKCEIFWQGVRLTKELGMYISLRSKGTWHDSTAHAIWECKEINDTVMVFKGRWRRLPISQLWRLQIKEENIIDWNVEMQIDGEVDLEREQTNIMLKDEYMNWSANNKKGEFTVDFNEDYGGDWESIWIQSPGLGPIGVNQVQDESLFLPSVAFDCSAQGNDYIANIVNSDRIFEARLLQCLRINYGKRANFSPCNYRYFKGTIKLQ